MLCGVSRMMGASDKSSLDRAEGLGQGYGERAVKIHRLDRDWQERGPRITDIENVEILFKDDAGYDTSKLLDSVKGHYGEY